ncbi:MAG TPA: sialate O-acetylesterase [Phycisphaerae bacterium]|nr:sialate O-acetylesterase [Phycisphaerae bacterium]
MIRQTFLGLLLLVPCAAARAEFSLASPFTDHAVLQQGASTAIWGKAAPSETVKVTLADQTVSATADADGKWMAHFKDLKAGGPFTLSVSGDRANTSALKLEDIYVGEVWLCSGQSNMDFTVAATPKYYFAGMQDQDAEVAAANFPTIRMFSGHWQRTYKPQDAIDGTWKPVSPETVKEMSAVGYFFARNLQKDLKVPVGILTETYGASCAEAWISREALAAVPTFKTWLDQFDVKAAVFPEAQRTAHMLAMKQFEIDVQKSPSIAQRVKEPRINGGANGDPADDQHQPTVLYNCMIAPILPYTLKGVLWYQGESIAKGVDTYPLVQETLIKDWRTRWNNPDMPFYIVQLAALNNNSNRPEVREAQATILKIPHAGMAVTTDIGDRTNVHPKNKQDVGDRLARIALANAYGREIEFSGPLYDSMAVEGNKIRIKFTHAENLSAGKPQPAGPGGGPRGRGGGAAATAPATVNEFTIAGADGKFVTATAVIDGQSVLVSSPDVPEPKNVRYCWSNYPESPNLYNAAGLPAAQFRTDAPTR